MNKDDATVGAQDLDERPLARLIADASPADPAPPVFDAIWARARAKQMQSRRRYTWLASAAVLVATLVVALTTGTQPTDDLRYIRAADLLDGTAWAAPSDTLLPDYEFDLYEEFSGFATSTKPVEGALL